MRTESQFGVPVDRLILIRQAPHYQDGGMEMAEKRVDPVTALRDEVDRMSKRVLEGQNRQQELAVLTCGWVIAGMLEKIGHNIDDHLTRIEAEIAKR